MDETCLNDVKVYAQSFILKVYEHLENCLNWCEKINNEIVDLKLWCIFP